MIIREQAEDLSRRLTLEAAAIQGKLDLLKELAALLPDDKIWTAIQDMVEKHLTGIPDAEVLELVQQLGLDLACGGMDTEGKREIIKAHLIKVEDGNGNGA